MRAIAHIRFTAVGREALSSAIAGCRAASAAPPSAAATSRAASTTPQAAAMPIAGAPRTTRARMASLTWWLSVHCTYSTTEREQALVEQFQQARLPADRADAVVAVEIHVGRGSGGGQG